jgi:hypothetical protein
MKAPTRNVHVSVPGADEALFGALGIDHNLPDPSNRNYKLEADDRGLPCRVVGISPRRSAQHLLEGRHRHGVLRPYCSTGDPKIVGCDQIASASTVYETGFFLDK